MTSKLALRQPPLDTVPSAPTRGERTGVPPFVVSPELSEGPALSSPKGQALSKDEPLRQQSKGPEREWD